MTPFYAVLKESWESLCLQYQAGKFSPELEEDLQCFLYHECLLRLKDANKIHAKVSRGTKAEKGKWVFPDLSLGDDELVAEIKFIGKGFSSAQANSVRVSAINSLTVMSTHPWYQSRERCLVFFDERKHLWEHDRDSIRDVGSQTPVLFYPQLAPRIVQGAFGNEITYPHGWKD